jgi:hypothetical protein
MQSIFSTTKEDDIKEGIGPTFPRMDGPSAHTGQLIEEAVEGVR